MTQKQYLLEYMRKNKHRRVPIYEFVALGIYRYSARIFDLRQEWYNIVKKEELAKHQLFKNQRHVSYRIVID